MTRWVRIDVSLFDHPFFASKEARSELEAWSWLIANVAWKDTTHRVGNEMLDVPAGSLFVTLRSLQVAWRWKSDKRVRSFLSRLEREEMIRTKTDAKKTHISICNYSRYQDTGRKEDATRTQPGRNADAQKTPIHHLTTPSLHSGDARAKKKASRMPADFHPDIEFAISEGMTRIQAEREALAIRDWSASSPNGAKLDWPATWRGWIRRKLGEQASSKPDTTLKALDRMIDSERPNIFDALTKTIDHEAERTTGPSTAVRIPSYAQGH